MPRHLPAILFCTLALAGCMTASDPVPTAVDTVEPVKGPPACTQPIGDYVNVIEADVTSGNLNRDVHRRITNDLFGVRSHCASGRVDPALVDLSAIKARYGYR